MAPPKTERYLPAEDDVIQPALMDQNQHANGAIGEEEPMDADENPPNADADSDIEVVYDGPSTNYRHPIPEQEHQDEGPLHWDSDEETSHLRPTRPNGTNCYSPIDDYSDDDDDQEENGPSEPPSQGPFPASACIVPENREAANNAAQRYWLADQSETNDLLPPIEHWPLIDILGKAKNEMQTARLQDMLQWIAEQIRHTDACILKNTYNGIIRRQILVRLEMEIKFLNNLHKNASILKNTDLSLPSKL